MSDTSRFERYGTGAGRAPFETSWAEDAARPFEVAADETFARLRCPRDLPSAWATRSVPIDPARPLVVALKLLCRAEERGPHVVVGVRARGRGAYLLRQGGLGYAWNDLGAFDAPGPNRPMAGFNTNDWHVLTFRIAPGWDRCQVFYDTAAVLEFGAPWPSGVDGEDDAIVIGSEHPTQEILLHWLWVGQTEPPLETLYLPALFPIDWELEDAAIEIGRVARHPASPVLRPGPPGALDDTSASEAWVIREPDRYRMWYVGKSAQPRNPTCAIFHAESADGVAWRRTAPEPVLWPGGPEEWDGGGVQSPIVRRDRDGYRMWYAGYLPGYREGRTGLARSPDGLRWERVPMNAFSFRGSLGNNICYPLQDTIWDNQYTMPQCVIVDEDAPPERRYVLFVHAQGRGSIVGLAYSPDGRAFVKDDRNARYYAVDERSPEIGHLHQKTSVVHRDGCWFAFFGHLRRTERGPELRTYFTAWRDETTDGANPSFGAWQATLQLDTIPDTWEGQLVYPSCLLEDGDEWKLYYRGTGADAPDQVGLATVQRDRLWRLTRAPNAATGTALSRPITRPVDGWASYRLTVNATGLGDVGTLRIGLVDAGTGAPIDGYRVDDCEPVAEGFATPVRWQGDGEDLPAAVGTLRIAVAVSGQARLHALRFTRIGNGESAE